MLSELTAIDIQKYVKDIMKISKTFSDIFLRRGIKLYTNGTDSHIILVDLRESMITGKDCEDLLFRQHILVNRNQLPNDKKPPNITSGIRIGVLTLATINMSENTIKKRSIINENLASEIIQLYRIIE